MVSNEKSSQNRFISKTILFCFFGSGFLGLIYEIIWIRKLGLIFGTTVFAISSVLAAFFGGLALGSFLFGKLSRYISNPIKTYAFLELAISIFAFLFPTLLGILGWVYGIFYSHIYHSFFALTLTRFILFALLLVFPTTMMGGTLPIISQYFIRSKQNMGKSMGILYGLNTFGAFLGTLVCGFYLIRVLGVNTTNYLAGTASTIIFLIAYFLGNRSNIYADASEKSINFELIRKFRSLYRPIRNSADHENSMLDPGLRYLLICFLLSGFASLGYELAWTRYLSLPLANIRYTYTIILATFILGTALGSIIFSSLFDRIKNGVRFFALLEIGIGLSASILVPVVYSLSTKLQYSLLLFDFLICGGLMLIPTVFMGATFPVVVKTITARSDLIGHVTGRAYGVNTLGSILGSLATGFLLIPALGIRHSLNILIAINILIGFFCLFRDSKRSWMFSSIAVAVTLSSLLISHFLLKVEIPEDFLMILKKPSEEITLIEEGLENTVWVTSNRQNQQKSIWANQTVLGRTCPKEPYAIAPQVIAGHIPMLLHPGECKKILGICLGTGQTFGSILFYDIERIDVVEISKTIVDVGLEEFKDYNNDLGNDKRVNIIVEDGRNFVAHARETYDLITLEPSPPEEAGIVNLYTKEFYQLSKERLNKDGIMSQWLPIYSTHPDETASIIKTFITVFPNSILWYNNADLILLGINGEIKIDVHRIESLLRDEAISSQLSISYLGHEEYNLNHIQNLFACLLMGPKELYEFSSSAAPITDNHPAIEYTFLKYEDLKNKPERLTIYNTERIEQNLAPLNTYLHFVPDNILGKIEEIRMRYISRLYADTYSRLAMSKAKQDQDEVVSLYKKALEYDPSYGIVYANLGSYYYEQGEISEAVKAYEKAVQVLPNLPELWHMLGTAYWYMKRHDKAIEAWERSVSIKPDFSEAYNDLGVGYTILGQYDKAIEAYKKTIQIKPDFADAYYNLGLVYERTSQRENAIAAYEEAVRINPNFTEALARLRAIIY